MILKDNELEKLTKSLLEEEYKYINNLLIYTDRTLIIITLFLTASIVKLWFIDEVDIVKLSIGTALILLFCLAISSFQNYRFKRYKSKVIKLTFQKDKQESLKEEA